MRRLLFLAALTAIVIAAVWFSLQGSQAHSTKAITTLLPRDTIALVYLPDFKEARDGWRQTDLYRLWREPAMQQFLARPLERSTRPGELRAALGRLDQLGLQAVFAALIAWDKEEPRFAAGFRFTGDRAEVEQFVASFRDPLRRRLGAPPVETIDYEKHKIEVTRGEGADLLATVYAGDWFFLSNDLPQIQRMLDRVDGRTVDQSTTLAVDNDFQAALRHMPRRYAWLAYARADHLLARFAPKTGPTDLRAVAAALEFEDRRMRETLFVGRPKAQAGRKLQRVALPMASADTFLLATSLLNLEDKGAASGLRTLPIPSRFLSGVLEAFSSLGLSAAEWKEAFSAEASLLGEWQTGLPWPGFVVTVPVKNRERAEAILSRITSRNPELPWRKEEKEKTTFYSRNLSAGPIALAPTIALSDRMLVMAQDRRTVENMLAPSGERLTSTALFRAAERTVSKPDTSFVFIDPALFYRRLDATIRPFLLMSAAFVPALSESVDLSKLPEAEMVAQYLTPITLSQRYEKDGYVTASVGPITLFQGAAVAIIAAGGAAAIMEQLTPRQPFPSGQSPAQASPAPLPPTPTPTPP